MATPWITNGNSSAWTALPSAPPFDDQSASTMSSSASSPYLDIPADSTRLNEAFPKLEEDLISNFNNLHIPNVRAGPSIVRAQILASFRNCRDRFHFVSEVQKITGIVLGPSDKEVVMQIPHILAFDYMQKSRKRGEPGFKGWSKIAEALRDEVGYHYTKGSCEKYYNDRMKQADADAEVQARVAKIEIDMERHYKKKLQENEARMRGELEKALDAEFLMIDQPSQSCHYPSFSDFDNSSENFQNSSIVGFNYDNMVPTPAMFDIGYANVDASNDIEPFQDT